jgi:hypothetical protein
VAGADEHCAPCDLPSDEFVAPRPKARDSFHVSFLFFSAPRPVDFQSLGGYLLRLMNRIPLKVRNSGAAPLRLIVEPWAREYTLLPPATDSFPAFGAPGAPGPGSYGERLPCWRR